MKYLLFLFIALCLLSCEKKSTKVDTPNYLRFSLDGKNYEFNKDVVFNYGGYVSAKSSSVATDMIYIEFTTKGTWPDQYTEYTEFQLTLDGKTYSPFSVDNLGNPYPEGSIKLSYSNKSVSDKNGTTSYYIGTFSGSLYQIHQEGWWYNVSDGKTVNLTNGSYSSRY